MSAIEKGFLELVPEGLSTPGIVHSAGQSNSFELRRRILAEERTGEIVVSVPGLGYLALSDVYHQPTNAAQTMESQPEIGTEPSPDWIKLL